MVLHRYAAGRHRDIHHVSVGVLRDPTGERNAHGTRRRAVPDAEVQRGDRAVDVGNFKVRPQDAVQRSPAAVDGKPTRHSAVFHRDKLQLAPVIAEIGGEIYKPRVAFDRQIERNLVALRRRRLGERELRVVFRLGLHDLDGLFRVYARAVKRFGADDDRAGRHAGGEYAAFGVNVRKAAAGYNLKGRIIAPCVIRLDGIGIYGLRTDKHRVGAGDRDAFRVHALRMAGDAVRRYRAAVERVRRVAVKVAQHVQRAVYIDLAVVVQHIALGNGQRSVDHESLAVHPARVAEFNAVAHIDGIRAAFQRSGKLFRGTGIHIPIRHPVIVVERSGDPQAGILDSGGTRVLVDERTRHGEHRRFGDVERAVVRQRDALRNGQRLSVAIAHIDGHALGDRKILPQGDAAEYADVRCALGNHVFQLRRGGREGADRKMTAAVVLQRSGTVPAVKVDLGAASRIHDERAVYRDLGRTPYVHGGVVNQRSAGLDVQLAVFLQRQAAIQTTVIDQLRVRFDVQSGVAPERQTVIVMNGVCSFLDRERFARRYGEDRAVAHRDSCIPRDRQIVGERDRRV